MGGGKLVSVVIEGKASVSVAGSPSPRDYAAAGPASFTWGRYGLHQGQSAGYVGADKRTSSCMHIDEKIQLKMLSKSSSLSCTVRISELEKESSGHCQKIYRHQRTREQSPLGCLSYDEH